MDTARESVSKLADSAPLPQGDSVAIYTVKNRWTEPFIGMFDGQTYEVATTLTVPDFVAYHLKKQSIVRDNPVNAGANEYRLAIVELGDEDSPLGALPLESFDRTDLDEFRKVVIKPSGIRQAIPASKGAASSSIRTTE